MNRLFLTGDTHGPNDIAKLGPKKFPVQEDLDKEDYMLVAGDFGILFNYVNTGQSFDNNPNDKCWAPSEATLKYWYEERPFTTLFIDGNHENFDRLATYPVEEWNGGKIQKISDSIIHLMRGQVYDICGLKIFAFGGARSVDRGIATGTADEDRGKWWWDAEMPTEDEMKEGRANLEKCDYQVDYVITHTLPGKILGSFFYYEAHNELAKYFDEIDDEIKCRRWYSGHYHEDRTVGSHTLIYNDIVELTY